MSTDYETLSLHSENERKQLKGFVEEAVLHKRKIKLENEAIADIRKESKEKLGLEASTFNELVTGRLNDSFDKIRKKHDDFDTAVELLWPTED